MGNLTSVPLTSLPSLWPIIGVVMVLMGGLVVFSATGSLFVVLLNNCCKSFRNVLYSLKRKLRGVKKKMEEIYVAIGGVAVTLAFTIMFLLVEFKDKVQGTILFDGLAIG